MKISKLFFILFVLISSFSMKAQIGKAIGKAAKNITKELTGKALKTNAKKTTSKAASKVLKKKVTEKILKKTSVKSLQKTVLKSNQIATKSIFKRRIKKTAALDLKKWTAKQGFEIVSTKQKGVHKVYSKSQQYLGTVFQKGSKTHIVADETILLKNSKALKVNPILEKPIANATYKVNNTIFKTDHLGRTVFSKTPSIPKNVTNRKVIKGTNEQAKAIRKGGIKGSDDGGHLIAHSLGGNSGAVNIVAQSSKINRGKFRVLEDFAFKNKKFIKDYQVKAAYKSTRKRPSSFVQKLNFLGDKKDLLILKRKHPSLKYRKKIGLNGKIFYECLMKHSNKLK